MVIDVALSDFGSLTTGLRVFCLTKTEINMILSE
jgi:hypothetical protein